MQGRSMTTNCANLGSSFMHGMWPCLDGTKSSAVSQRTLAAIPLLRRRAAGDVPLAVVTLIAGMSVLDALLLAGAGHWIPAGVAMLAFMLTLLLQRWVSGT
jgi:hypothetical protein